MMPEFTAFPKIARLNRDIIITEKIDGTNAAVGVTEEGDVYAQSRTRIVIPESDNHGFARWVAAHADALRETLGPGIHFGEWWGNGIQRGYGLANGDKRFSLFNTARWSPPEARESLLGIDGDAVRPVPVLYEGPMSVHTVRNTVAALRVTGSRAAPGFMKPEGVVVYHTAARSMFKVTLEGDEKPKGSTE
jgi:hypothetical protein